MMKDGEDSMARLQEVIQLVTIIQWVQRKV
jgi:hypothetical protein